MLLHTTSRRPSISAYATSRSDLLVGHASVERMLDGYTCASTSSWATDRATEMIGDRARPELPSFMAEVAKLFRTNGVHRVWHGSSHRTGRREFLAWAVAVACIVICTRCTAGVSARGPGDAIIAWA
jgi:hypothetical protein